jgi:hypothetical protein
MKLPLNDDFVRAAVDSGLEERLVQAINEEIDRRQASFADRETFFATLSAVEGSAKGYWSRAIKKDRINDPKAVVKFLRLLRPAIEIDTRMEPWNSWRPGSQVIAFVGEREVSIPNVSQKVKQRVVGARDSQSFAELAKIMYRDIGLDCEVVLEHAPSLSKDEYADYLRERLHEPGVGMICVLGSPVVNPLANPAAREIFRDTTEDFLPRFRWAHKTSPENFLADHHFPGKRDPWAAEEEGVSLPNHRNLATPYPRVGDDLVLAQMEEGKTDFPDAGIFMMDCTHPAILVLCAGHGGCGARGCVSQLRDTELIDDALELSRTRKMEPTDTKPGRIVGVVIANRRRKSVRANDSGRAAKAHAAGPDAVTGVDDLQVVSARMVWASVPCRNWA